MKIFNKSVGVILITSMLMTSTVMAEPLSSELQSQQDKLKQDKAALQSVQEQLDKMEADIETLDDQVGNLGIQIDENKKKIIYAEREIATTEKGILSSKAEFEKSKELLGQRMRAMYISGTRNYLQLLMNSENLSDFVSRFQFIKEIINHDKNNMAVIKAKGEELIKKEEDLRDQKDSLAAINKDIENKKSMLDAEKEKQNKIIVDVKKNEKILASKVSTSQAQVNATLEQISSIRKNAPKVNLSRGASPFTTDNVIAFATNFLGTPYVWGGTKPNPGFDCSGFTQYVYGHFGIKLGRTTYDQINDGVQVSRDQLQPGDLVFFGSWSNPHHMGIYIGNNTYIHAPHTGDVVKVSTMTRSDYVTARRVR